MCVKHSLTRHLPVICPCVSKEPPTCLRTRVPQHVLPVGIHITLGTVDVGWITPQPFASPFSKNHVWCDSHGFPVALCCIVAGKDAVPFATVPKYYQKK